MKTTFPNGLYVITDPYLLPDNMLFSAVESALKGGAASVQYRDKTATAIDRLKNARNLRDLSHEFNAALIINDDLDLCQRISADGVHLGKSDGAIIEARNRLGADKILGVTCHNDLIYAQHCIDNGVDYCAFGRIFPSMTKTNAPHCTLDILEKASKLDTHIVAIGGITTENMHHIQNADIHTLAVIQGIFGQDDIESTARIFSSSLHNHFIL